MDPMFHESSSLHIGTPTSFQSNSQQQTPSAQSSQSYYTQQQGVSQYHNTAANSAVGNGYDDYSRSLGYKSGVGSDNQDTSAIQNFAQQHHSAAPAYSEATSTPTQEDRTSYSHPYDPNSRSPYPGSDVPAQSNQGNHYQEHANEGFGHSTGGGVNFQTLLDNLTPSTGTNTSHEGNAAASVPSHSSQTHGNTASASALPAAPNLPPRPPPQEKPATHPNYAPEDDIRSYHPHSRKTPNAPYRGQPVQPLMTAAAPGSATSNGIPNAPYTQPPPLSSTHSNKSPSTPNFRHRDSIDRRQEREDNNDEDARWPPEINRKYEDFLEDERRFVTDGQWDQFPAGSRLFIGNLPTEKVTKRDIFHRFYQHGKLAQISIKQAYGFVQFLDSHACYRALQAEQGQVVRGRKMHLEISKPQKNTRNADSGGNNARGGGARRRSRSPDYTRGGSASQGGRGVDRYTGSNNGTSPRDRDFRRGRDDYRPGRSPSPRSGRSGRNRDRSRDRYDGRRRSRSRSPLGRGGGRYRSPSPRREVIDDLPLPRRPPHEVPDVQVLVIDDLPREFIAWVERSFQERGVTCNVLLLSPRLSEAAVVRRQIIEGVQAVSKLNERSVQTSKISLQVFDRRGGADQVRFEEYADLDPSVAALLVLNAKQTHNIPLPPPPSTQYGLPQQTYGMPPAPASNYLPPQQTPSQNPLPNSNANLGNFISSLDSTGLQNLLGAMSQQPQQHPSSQSHPPQPSGISPDLARLLGAVGAQPPQQQPPQQQPRYSQQPPPANSNPYAALANNPDLASLVGGQAQAPLSAPRQGHPPPQNQIQNHNQGPPPGQPDMAEIMAQLAKYQRN